MKAFALIQMNGGLPNLNDGDESLPYCGHVLCAQIGNWGAYMITRTGTQLAAIRDLGLNRVVPICVFTEDGPTYRPELDENLTPAAVDYLNNWVDNEHPDWPRANTGHTYGQVVEFLFQKFHPNFDMRSFWVRGPEDA